MEEPGIKIDVRGMEKVSERPKKVSKELDMLEKRNYAEIVANDEKTGVNPYG